jgi:uncharacterized membrane protein (UPF0182 family)
VKDKRRKIITIVLIVAVVLIALITGLVGFITDFLWFRDLGYTAVFWKKLLTMLEIGIPIFIVLSVLGIIYLKAIRKGYFKRTVIETQTMGVKGQGRVGYLLAIVASFIVTYLSVTKLWFELLKFTNSTGFSLKDPIFNNDISFYIFKLQFIKELNSIIIVALIVFAVMTFIYYYFLQSVAKPAEVSGGATPEPEPEPQPKANAAPSPFASILKSLGLNFDNAGGTGFNAGAAASSAKKSAQGSGIGELVHIASKQITVLGILFFIMIGVSYLLKQFDLLYSNNGVVFGARYVDININLWVYRIIMALSVVSAIFFAIGIKKKKLKTVIIVPIIMVGIGILGLGAGLLVQNLIVGPNEITKEEPYLINNIAYTQNAYGLGDVSIKQFAATDTLTSEDIKANEDTIRNIRINDYDPTKTFYNLNQSIRQYYTFNDVDVDRYMINGQYTQTFLSAREIDESKISQQWLNVHLKYTHGYGITLSRVDKITESGQPDIMIKNIPPEEVPPIEEINIDRPEIYFGELQNEYIITNTSEKEFDYPEGTENKYTTYDSGTGIKLNLFNRLMFAVKERSMKLLVSTNITGDSKIIVKRNIMERVQTIMPYLDYGDPYMVTVDGKLYWIIDAFTTSSMYPYSEPYDIAAGNKTNYIRNSVKIVIDAYTGTTDFYTVDENDPVAATYAKIYPTLFKPAADMPESLKAHLRYPSLMLGIQANIYKKYHVDNVSVFYQGEDRWDVANEKLGASDREVPMTPNYYIMKLPGENDVEFINSIPYTPMNKVNMTALLIARNDSPHYGELMLLQLPKGRIIQGPAQIDAQIAQDPQISQDFSLWANSDSTYSRGNIFVVPIEDSLMYVEPIYLKAKDSSMPEVKRIIIYYKDRIAYESNLPDAIDSIFGAGTGDFLREGALIGDEGDADQMPGDPGVNQDSNGGDSQQKTTDELLSLAVTAYNNAIDAQKAGDWAKYGEYMKELEGYLTPLQPDAEQTSPAAVSGPAN